MDDAAEYVATGDPVAGVRSHMRAGEWLVELEAAVGVGAENVIRTIEPGLSLASLR